MRIPGLQSPTPARRELTAPLVESQPIRGTVRLAPGARSDGGGTLFVIARGAGAGPPLAVKRVPSPTFPARFEIGPQDVMMSGRPFNGPIRLSARLDRDGNPMTREPGGLHADLGEALQPGASGVELVLSADGSAPSTRAGDGRDAGDAGGGAGSISGILRLAQGAPGGAAGTVFVIARSPAGGPPVAVRRLSVVSFPVSFEIGPEHVMIPGSSFSGKLRLSARLDEDGDALSRGPGDLSGEAGSLLEPGARGVELVLAPAMPGRAP